MNSAAGFPSHCVTRMVRSMSAMRAVRRLVNRFGVQPSSCASPDHVRPLHAPLARPGTGGRVIHSLCVELRRLLPQLRGELAPAQASVATLGIERGSLAGVDD
jgi:hypothetical protein